MKFYTSVAKGLKLKVRKFWEIIPTFVEVTGKKLEGGLFAPSPVLNRVKIQTKIKFKVVLKGSKTIKTMIGCKNRRGLTQVKAIFFAYKLTRNIDML